MSQELQELQINGIRCLGCPCGGEQLHQQSIKVYKEDYYIDFECEHCDHLRILKIYQHKGLTLIKWVKDVKRTHLDVKTFMDHD